MADLSASTPSEPTGAEASGVPADPVPDHDVRAVLAITPFRRLWLALGLSSFGDWLGLLATTALAAALPQTPAAKLLAVSGIFILRLAPAVFFGPLAGVVADRLPRRWTLVYGDVLRFLLFCSIPLVGTLWWLYVATVLVEVVGLFWMPAKDATVPNLVPRRRLEAANQLSLVVTYGSAPLAALAFSGLSLVSGMVDGVIPHFQGHPTFLALYVDALTYLVSAAVIWRLDFPEKVSHTERQESILRTAVDGWKFIGGTPLVRGLVLGMLGRVRGGRLRHRSRAELRRRTGRRAARLRRPVRRGVRRHGCGHVGRAAAARGVLAAPAVRAGHRRGRRVAGADVAGAEHRAGRVLHLGLGACAGAAWVTGYTLLGLEVGDDVRGRTFAFVQSMVRVVLISVLAIGPVVAAGLLQGPRSASHGAPHRRRQPHLHRRDGDLPARRADRRWPSAWCRSARWTTGPASRWSPTSCRRCASATCTTRPRGATPTPAASWSSRAATARASPPRCGCWASGCTDQGYRARLTHEPGATPVGRRLREVLLHGEPLTARAEALLFAADRAHHVESVVRPGARGRRDRRQRPLRRLLRGLPGQRS